MKHRAYHGRGAARLFPGVMLTLLASIGPICGEGPYDQKTVDTQGDIVMTLVDVDNTCDEWISDDADEAICLPVVRFSTPVTWVEITNGDGEMVFSASCNENVDCIERLSCERCSETVGVARSNEASGDDYSAVYDYYESDITCGISPKIFVDGNSPACNDAFTILAGDTALREGRHRFYNLYEYNGNEWGI